MTATEMIESLAELTAELQKRRQAVGAAARAGLQWAGLKSCGGQRDDHAAAVLADLQFRQQPARTAAPKGRRRAGTSDALLVSRPGMSPQTACVRLCGVE